MNQILKHPVVSTVVGGLVLSILVWVFGILPDVWLFIQNLAKSIGSTLSTKIGIPVWIILIFAIPILFSIKNVISLLATKVSESIPEQEATEESIEQPVEFTDEECSVLALLVKKDGKAVGYSDLNHYLRLPYLQAQQILEALVRLDLIGVHDDRLHGQSVYLTKRGRDFMLGNKYERT